MKFYATLSVRSDWGPQELETYDLGEVTLEKLKEKLEEFTNNESLVVNISLWNQEKLARLRDKS